MKKNLENKKPIKENQEQQENQNKSISTNKKQPIKKIIINSKKKILDFFAFANKKFNFDKTKFNVLELTLVIVMTLISGIFIGEIIFYNQDGNVKINQGTLSEIESVYRTLIKEYYGDVSEKQLTEAAIKGMMNLLNDQHSVYMDDNTTEEFNEQLDGEFTGLGIEITLKENGIAYINKVFENSAAEKMV